MGPRTGRPLSDNPRQERVETKMTKEELKKLDYCCQATGKSRSEVIRAGIDVIYENLDKPEQKQNKEIF